MKKIWIITISVCVLLLLSIILYFTLKPKQNNLINITGNELLEKLENKDTFILLVSQEGCSHCEEYKPILNRVLVEYNINAYELDLTKLREDKDLYNKVTAIFNTQGTPTTIFINDGEEKTVINRLIGSTTYNSLIEKLKERGFIN